MCLMPPSVWKPKINENSFSTVEKRRKLTIISVVIMVVAVVIDQIIKILVRTNMTAGETIPVIGNWFLLHFIENEGIAFGVSFGENIGKLLLSLFRIGIVSFLTYYVFRMIKEGKLRTGTVVLSSMVLAGAIGNIIDSMFYGIIFNYAPFLYGRVVDMFYFPLFLLPEWFPVFGGEYFFPAIFNFADSCVTVGLIGLLFFIKDFAEKKK